MIGSAVNFRPLAAAAAEYGLLRAGLLYRSGSLAGLTPEHGDLLVSRLGVRLFVDFRTPEEIRSSDEPAMLRALGIAWVNLPIAGYPEAVIPGEERADSWGTILANGAPAFLAFFEMLAEDRYPLAFGCALGKDRTGVASALVLSALGLGRRSIESDYLETARHLEENTAVLSPGWTRRNMDRETYLRTVLPDPATFSRHFEAAGGCRGLANYLSAIGVTDSLRRAVRRRLLRTT